MTGNVTQHIASIHRRELITISQQNDASLGRHCIQQSLHQSQVYHRRLIDHETIHHQRIRCVMPKTVTGGIALITQQTMQRAGLIRQQRGDLRRQRQPGACRTD